MALRDGELNPEGWGYKDSFMFVTDPNKKVVQFTGSRYSKLCGVTMPYFMTWLEQNIGADFSKAPMLKRFTDHVAPPPKENPAFVQHLAKHNIECCTDGSARLMRAHGQNLADIMRLRNGKFVRIPDIVVFPESERDVIEVVEAANKYCACIIPVGGRTNVTNALDCPESEMRMIVSLDMTRMNKLKWINEENMTARAEAGIIGQELENQLNAKGFTSGHEPDSLEFSSLGGWVSTRASGMKRGKYGNIEDLVEHVTFVTSRGILQRSCETPRISAGPDIQQVILGSEGTLGVITEVTFKVWPLPECKRYQNIIFPNFESGLAFAREVAMKRCSCAAFRVIDAVHLSLAMALRPPLSVVDHVKLLFLTKIKRYNLNDVSAAVLIFEGTKLEVEKQEKRLIEIARKYGGIVAGSKGCERAYAMTFAVGYLRDFTFNHCSFGESFETAVPWEKVLLMCTRVKAVINSEFVRLGAKAPFLNTFRLTQLYDAGACIYFYCGFNYVETKDAMHVYEQVEEAARREILACGGNISHHHGVGKLRAAFLPETISDVGISILRSIKKELDPNNVFASGNLFTVSKM